FPFVCLLGNSVSIHCHRGELAAAEELIQRYTVLRGSADVSERAGYAWPESRLRLARGDSAGALEVAVAAWDIREAAGINSESIKEVFAIALRAALETGDRARAEALLETVESAGRGTIPPLMRAYTIQFRARPAADAGDLE